MIVPADLGLPADRFPSFRSEVRQFETIIELAGSGARFNLLQAPTGAGKSLIYNGLGQFLGGRYLILTGTKQLQDQNMEAFESIGMRDVRGHGNYGCAIRDRSPYEPACKFPRIACEWQRDIDEARRAQAVVTNYAFWLSMGDPTQLGRFDLLICDEAHTCLDWLTSAASVAVQPSVLHEVLGMGVPSELFAGLDPGCSFAPWAVEVLRAARTALRTLLRAGNGGNGSGNGGAGKPSDRETRRRTAYLQGLVRDMERLAGAPRSGTPWVVELGDEGSAGSTTSGASDPLASSTLHFKPVWPAHYAEDMLLRGIPNVLLTSATLSPAVGRHLGLDPADTAWHEVESGFDPRRRPIYVMPSVKVEYEMSRGDLQRMANLGDLFLAPRMPDRKGLIQVPSYRLAGQIHSLSRLSAHFITHARRAHRDALSTFEAAEPPAVLLSPAVKEGWDGRDDRARFTWIPKIPLLNRKIPLIRARCSLDPTWHDVEVATTVMQWIGRIVRSSRDWGEALVTDKNAAWLFGDKNRALWPRGVLAAVRWVREIPGRLEVGP